MCMSFDDSVTRALEVTGTGTLFGHDEDLDAVLILKTTLMCLRCICVQCGEQVSKIAP